VRREAVDLQPEIHFLGVQAQTDGLSTQKSECKTRLPQNTSNDNWASLVNSA
jgi:hypothetical protein